MTPTTNQFVDRLDDLLPDDELIRLATDLTAIPSFTGEETELAQFIRDLLLRNGFDAYTQEVSPGREQAIGLLGPAGARPALLYNGHLDMDPLGRDHPADPFVACRDGDKLYGAGLHNMKSGLAAILGAALAVRRSGLPLVRPLLLEFVAGELQGGVGTRFALRSGLTADAAVVPEPYSVRRVITRTAGVHKFGLVVRGRTAHTSRHTEGVDAVAILRRALDHLDDADLGLRNPDFPPLPRLQVSGIIAGRGENHELSGISYLADKATALIDIRYPPPYEPADVVAAIDSAVADIRALFPAARITIDSPPEPGFRIGGSAMPPMDVPPDSPIVTDIVSLLPLVSEFAVTETGLALPFSYCGNDTTHLSRAGIDCCLFGPRGAAGDTEHHVLVSEMRACARTLAVLAWQRCA
ncbi:M20/M25/M40 family metallo-hydrolase [Nocardia sp. NPDC051833]|uniref:M20 family metallopeptidase n=1 Tax=Nocardia sp. NPDC051833 TaxID=3155674 RepID=UPI00343AFF25